MVAAAVTYACLVFTLIAGGAWLFARILPWLDAKPYPSIARRQAPFLTVMPERNAQHAALVAQLERQWQQQSPSSDSQS